MKRVLLVAGMLGWAATLVPGESVRVSVATGTARELATKARLEAILASVDLSRYTFTREVVIEEGARSHAMPVLTLNVRHADSSDDLLASFLHEQIHWHVKEHEGQLRRAVRQLQRMYPGAPVGLPEGAETRFSTYGHLVTCYLEAQALRILTGAERAAAVVARKTHYLWVYKTVLSTEGRIGGLVRAHGLDFE